MNKFVTPLKPAANGALLLTACASLLLTACGGGDPVPFPQANAIVTLQMQAPAEADAAEGVVVQPSFHVAPEVLVTPDDADADVNDASTRRQPTRRFMAGFGTAATRRLTLQAIEAARLANAAGATGEPVDGVASPMASAGVVFTYTPAQIRSAYGLPMLPAQGTAPTAAQAAQMGAGQTIYIVDAMHDPNVAAELAAFNQKFGLPLCTSKAIAVNASLPLVAPSGTSCDLSVVYTSPAGAMTGAAPAYNAGWATEITLDVQWAHATAPLARIVLIEAPDASVNSLVGAVQLANAMGPGVVSMSFGAPEGTWTASVDAAFTAPKMTYLAATGDSGAAVSWPSVSQNVVAVGGTTLTYSGAGTRSEVGWSGTGGGISAYTPAPNYQTSAVPGMGAVARRAVADVAFNADPASGQYVAVQAPGSSTVSWLSAGGTSLSTPQWAGLIAVANATRALAAKPALGTPHSILYGQIAVVPGTYASAFADITKGTDGTCATCTAKTGYDPLSGLGTPNAGSLINLLSGATASVTPPVVTGATVSGKPGIALAFTVAVSAANPVSYTLIGAPAAMGINSAGVVNWANPVVGTYSVTVVAKDSKTGLTGQGIFTVKIATVGPVITAPAMTGVAGKVLSGSVSISDPGAAWVSLTISGAPAGMAFVLNGLTVSANWPKPVTGSYSLKVSVVDSAGLTAQATVPVTIAAK